MERYRFTLFGFKGSRIPTFGIRFPTVYAYDCEGSRRRILNELPSLKDRLVMQSVTILESDK